MTAPPSHSLRDLERWMFTVLTHAEGVAEGAGSAEARASLDVDPQHLDQVIAPNQRMTSAERLGVYAGMYQERLIGALTQDHPGVRHAVGSGRFRTLARNHASRHPSTFASLNDYGDTFVPWLAEHLTDEDPVQFLVELATLERALVAVFHAQAGERLAVSELQSLEPSQLPEVHLTPVPAARLFTFQYPVLAYREAVDAAEAAEVPALASTHVLLARPRYTVLQQTLAAAPAAVLKALFDGHSLGEAIASMLEETGTDPSSVSGSLGAWFEEWAELGLFQPLSLPHTRGDEH